MPRFGLHVRDADETARVAKQLNWRRGLWRVWLLVSAAWTMGWIVYLILYGIQSGFQGTAEYLAIPVLLPSCCSALWPDGRFAVSSRNSASGI